MKKPLKKVVVHAFGSAEQMALQSMEPTAPQAGEVVIELLSIGMNQADLMARRGEYRLSSGEPPFTPGIEGNVDALTARDFFDSAPPRLLRASWVI
ncbi:MAG: hypothetical protein AAFY72_08055, partial [Cyanobacteria bacterium J06649_4]